MRVKPDGPHRDTAAVVRLFNDHIDFSEDGNGWYGLREILGSNNEDLGSNEADRADLRAWAWAYFLPDIKLSCYGQQIIDLLVILSYQKDPIGVQRVQTILNLNSDLATALSPGGPSALHAALSVYKSGSMIRALAIRGANLHLVGRCWSQIVDGKTDETPTSLAMRHSYQFFVWREVLKELGQDLEVFVKEELQQFPLVLAGWAEDTLLALFAYEFEPCDLRAEDQCAKCMNHMYLEVLREFWWEELLGKIKAREDLNAGNEVFEAPLLEGKWSCRECHKPEETLYHRQGENFCRYCHEPGDDAFHEEGERVCQYCHQPGDDVFHSKLPDYSKPHEGERSCNLCRWKLDYPRTSLVLDENGDAEQSFDVESVGEDSSEEDYSPLLIHA